MGKFYDIMYDEKVWSIKGDKENGYRISKNGTYESHFLKGNIVGIYQVTNNSFLIYYKVMRDKWKVIRLRLVKGGKIIEYVHRFNEFDFITDDLILFDKNYVQFTTLYSISKNHEISDIKSLISKSDTLCDCKFCKSREIKLIYTSEDSEFPTCLQVDYELKSFYCKEFIQVLIDPITLSPLPLTYSTLRNKYISLNDSFTLKNLFDEHEKELKVIEDFLCQLYQLYYSDNRKTDAELFSELNNH